MSINNTAKPAFTLLTIKIRQSLTWLRILLEFGMEGGLMATGGPRRQLQDCLGLRHCSAYIACGLNLCVNCVYHLQEGSLSVHIAHRKWGEVCRPPTGREAKGGPHPHSGTPPTYPFVGPFISLLKCSQWWPSLWISTVWPLDTHVNK